MYRSEPNRIAKGYFWLAERLYNELAWVYDPVSWVVSLGQWHTVRKWALDYLTGNGVLEVGFGTGELLLEMARRELQVIGLDPSRSMHRLTQSKLRHHGLCVPLVQGITQQMPFADSTFDTMIATFPAGNIFDPATWCEAARVLRKPIVLTEGCGGRVNDIRNPQTTVMTEGCGGRFVVVGACASVTARPDLPFVPFFFGLSIGDLLQHFHRLAQSAGLEARVLMRRQGMLNIPVIIAETQP